MSEWISRPPFDEKGYAGGVVPGNRKKRKIRRWLLPALLCATVIVGAVLLRRNRTPEERCYTALLEAFAYGCGYESPVLSAMDLRALAELVQSGKLQADWKVSLESSNVDLAEMGLADYVDSDDIPDVNLLAGVGLRSKLSVYGKEATSHGLYVSYGALAFPLTELYVSGDKIAFAVPQLSKKVIRVAPDKLLKDWNRLPQWEWADESMQDDIRKKIAGAAEGITAAKAAGNRFLDTIYGIDGKYWKEFLKSFTVEKMQTKEENATRHLYVGGKKQVCQGYRLQAESKKLTEKLMQILGKSEDALRLAGTDSDTVEVRIYLTKGGELAMLECECSLWLGEIHYPMQITVELTGKTHSADDFTISISTGAEKKEICSVKRSLVRDGKTIEGIVQAKIAYGKLDRSGEAHYVLDTAKRRMECEMSYAVRGNVQGTASFEATFTSDEEQWKASLKKLKFTDPGNGDYVSVNTNLTVSPLTKAPSAPEGEEQDLFVMTREDWEKIKEEITENMQTFVDLFDKLY